VRYGREEVRTKVLYEMERAVPVTVASVVYVSTRFQELSIAPQSYDDPNQRFRCSKADVLKMRFVYRASQYT
jgi:hypothetical protein